MKVTVRLFASLRVNRQDSAALELPESSTVGEALSLAGVPETEAKIIFVNSRHASWTSPLSDGDLVAAFPPVGGG
jgi:molybdopterin converting factor small subunit